MKQERTSLARRLMVVATFVLLSSVSLLFSAYLLLTAQGNFVHLIAIAFTSLALFSALFNSITAYAYYKSYFYDAYFERLTKSLRPLKRYPSVALVLPTYKEELKTVELAMCSFKKLSYPKSKIRFYLHDDSKDPRVKEQKRELARKLGYVYVTRPENKDFKAGALNNVLAHSNEEFVAVFDADEQLVDCRYLLDLMPYFGDTRVAFVQTEKSMPHTGSIFMDSVNLFDGLFFKFMQPSRALHGTAIFAGSCGIIRRSALDAVGGFPRYVTEDAFFSFESDMHGFKSVYVPRIYALGKPHTFSEVSTQQWRYNYGDTQFLFYFLKRIMNQKKGEPHSTFLSKIDYFAYGFGLNYLSSVLILFTLLAMLTVFATMPATYVSLGQMLLEFPTALYLELLGIAAFVLSLMVPVVLTKAYFNSISEGFMLFILNFALAFARLKGSLAALAGMAPGKSWLKGSALRVGSVRFLSVMRTTAIELVFSTLIFAICTIAALANNVTGFVWLLWYGALYTSPFFFFYKYG